MANEELEEWHSSITNVERNKLSTYGFPQESIIREFSYEEMVFLLLKGCRPSTIERTLLRSVIVSHVSHGITGQSTLAVRMAADTRASFLHALIAGFSTGAGAYHQGGLEATMRELIELHGVPEGSLEATILDRLSRGHHFMGFGHRFHKEHDPRADTLIEIADEIGHTGSYFTLVKKVAAIIRREKSVPMNIEAAGGALLLDIGIEPEIAHIIIIIGRAPMFAAAYAERLRENKAPFQRIKVFDNVGPQE